MSSPSKSFRDRLADKDLILVAEGYSSELERRGVLKTGVLCPNLVAERPDAIEQLHRDYVHAGSDVVVAFTDCCHLGKPHLMSQDASMEENARKALRFARKVADETGTLMAGRICHSTIYDPSKPETEGLVCCIFKASIEWAVQEGADFIIGESFMHLGEAKLALECIKEYGAGLASVITILPTPDLKTRDAVSLGEACMELESIGADVIGLNCSHDPDAYARLLTDLRPRCKCALAALPMGRQMADDGSASQSDEIARFARTCSELGIRYVGLCCGNSIGRFRELACALRHNTTPAQFPPTMVRSGFDMTDTRSGIGAI